MMWILRIRMWMMTSLLLQLCTCSSSENHHHNILPWLRRIRGGIQQPWSSSDLLRQQDFQLLNQSARYQGKWRSIIQREIRYPDGREVDFEVIDQNGGSVLVFIWNTTSQTTTLVEEFAPGHLDLIQGPVAGGIESHKHKDALEAAQHELEEEAHLIGGKWINLLDANKTIIADKYSTATFHFYLVIDPEIEFTPKAQDHEELLVIHRGIALAQVHAQIMSGRMTVPAALASLLAIEKLRTMGLIEKAAEARGLIERASIAAAEEDSANVEGSNALEGLGTL